MQGCPLQSAHQARPLARVPARRRAVVWACRSTAAASEPASQSPVPTAVPHSVAASFCHGWPLRHRGASAHWCRHTVLYVNLTAWQVVNSR